MHSLPSGYSKTTSPSGFDPKFFVSDIDSKEVAFALLEVLGFDETEITLPQWLNELPQFILVRSSVGIRQSAIVA
jgi:hypothetical protein